MSWVLRIRVRVNMLPEAVTATGNWWGDPNGPFGPHGAGISGPVDYANFLTTPVVLGFKHLGQAASNPPE